MKTLNTVIREMYTPTDNAVDLDESTKAYAASLEKMASDKKLKNISKKDRDILAKLADMMKNANEEVDLNEGKMKEFHAMVKKGMTAAQIAKKIGMKEKDVAEFMKGMDESVDLDINEVFEALDEEDEILEDYFKVQYFGKDGKPEAGKESSFKDEESAKRYLARAQKAVKVGEYKLSKEKGKLESVDLDINEVFEALDEAVADWTVTVAKPVNKLKKGDEKKVKARSAFEAINKAMKLWGDPSLKAAPASSFKVTKESVELEEKNGVVDMNESESYTKYGVSQSLVDAVNRVVTGQSESVEIDNQSENDVIEHGAEMLGEDNTNDKSDDGEGLDKVQPKAVKKKFKDRKDKDIDNDGDVDSSDKFLHKRRKAVSKAVSKDENADEGPDEDEKSDDKDDKPADKKAAKKKDDKDIDSGKKEKVDVDPKLDESMFKKKYGSRWEAVMEATSQKLAMKNTK